MILLSNVIKSQWAGPDRDEQKVISIRMVPSQKNQEQPALMFQFDNEKRRIIAKAQNDAENILNEAQLAAQVIREQIASEQEAWKQEKSTWIEQAKQQGFAKGHAEGKEQGYNEYHEMIDFAHEVVDASKKDYQAKIDSSEQTLLDLGMKVAEKILGMELAGNEQAFLSLVKRALKEVHKYHEIQLHVHPRRYDLILAHKEELTAIFPMETDIYIYPDDELSEESCVIESPGGRMDASVDGQLAEVKRQLHELLESDNG